MRQFEIVEERPNLTLALQSEEFCAVSRFGAIVGRVNAAIDGINAKLFPYCLADSFLEFEDAPIIQAKIELAFGRRGRTALRIKAKESMDHRRPTARSIFIGPFPASYPQEGDVVARCGNGLLGEDCKTCC